MPKIIYEYFKAQRNTDPNQFFMGNYLFVSFDHKVMLEKFS